MAEIIGKSYKANLGKRIDESDLKVNLESALITLSRISSHRKTKIEYLRQDKSFCYAICSQNGFMITSYIHLEYKLIEVSVYGSMEEELVKKSMETLFSARNIETENIYSNSR